MIFQEKYIFHLYIEIIKCYYIQPIKIIKVSNISYNKVYNKIFTVLKEKCPIEI